MAHQYKYILFPGQEDRKIVRNAIAMIKGILFNNIFISMHSPI